MVLDIGCIKVNLLFATALKDKEFIKLLNKVCKEQNESGQINETD